MEKGNWIIITISGIVLLLVLLIGVPLLGGWGYRGWGMMGPGMMGGWGFGTVGWIGMIFMWLIPVGLLILVVMGIIALARGFSRGSQGGTTSQHRIENQFTAREILQVRYARGEISREEYQQMLDDIS